MNGVSDMNRSLLNQFIVEECTRHVRDLLLSAIHERTDGRIASAPKFEFNRFEVTIDAADGAVLLEDVLDASDSGVQKVSLEEFEIQLRDGTRAPQ